MSATTKLSRTEVVTRIKELIREKGRINWEIGDLTLELIPMGDRRGPNGAGEEILALAAETGVDPGVLEERRFVSHRTPFTARAVNVAWSVYREIAYRPDAEERARLHQMILTETPPPPQKWWTVSLVREKNGRRPMLHVSEPLVPHVEAAPVEEKVKAAEILLNDPDVLDRIATPGTPVAEAFDDAVGERLYRPGHILRPEKVKEIRENDPLVKGIDAGRALMDLERAMRVFVTDVAAIFPRVTGLPDRDHDIWQREMYLRNYLARSQGAVDQIKALLDTGKPGGDIDNFLRDVLADAKGGGEA